MESCNKVLRMENNGINFYFTGYAYTNYNIKFGKKFKINIFIYHYISQISMLDRKDEKILKELKRDAKQTSKQISNRTLIPITTVHNRIKKLEKLGIIQNYTIQLNDKRLGTISAFVMATINHLFLKSDEDSQKDLFQELNSHPEVEYTGMLTGGHDIMLKVRVKNISELDEFVIKTLRKMNGIEKTQTMIVLNESYI